ncbi:MAG: YicC family protein [Flammeovirgaceae bacterium]|nr:YicC family protein [Flammeovirgaceae bacterium]
MITSMTGFGSAEKITEKYSLKVEIKTLNSKFFDASLRLPQACLKWEMEIKALLEKELGRGKINLGVHFELKSFEQPPIQINQELFDAYYKRLEQLSGDLGASGKVALFKMAMNMPNVILHEEHTEGNISFEAFKEVLLEGVANCNQFRLQEGANLKEALVASHQKIRNGLSEVEERDPGRIENLKSRIHQSLEEIKQRVKVDENRFEQELIYYIEKLDLTEEKIRLGSHLDYFIDVISDDKGASGKKLGFLCQELGREINTIGSKANDAGIQRSVVGMKEELEKIKEQILNIL